MLYHVPFRFTPYVYQAIHHNDPVVICSCGRRYAWVNTDYQASFFQPYSNVTPLFYGDYTTQPVAQYFYATTWQHEKRDSVIGFIPSPQVRYIQLIHNNIPWIGVTQPAAQHSYATTWQHEKRDSVIGFIPSPQMRYIQLIHNNTLWVWAAQPAASYAFSMNWQQPAGDESTHRNYNAGRSSAVQQPSSKSNRSYN